MNQGCHWDKSILEDQYQTAHWDRKKLLVIWIKESKSIKEIRIKTYTNVSRQKMGRVRNKKNQIIFCKDKNVIQWVIWRKMVTRDISTKM